MSELQSLLKQYTASSRTSLLSTARKSAAEALLSLRALKEGSEKELLSAVVASALGADGALSDEELDFMSELFSAEFTREHLSRLTERCKSEGMRAATDRVVDSLDKKGKRALCTLCLCILASDHKVTGAENAFLLRLME